MSISSLTSAYGTSLTDLLNSLSSSETDSTSTDYWSQVSSSTTSSSSSSSSKAAIREKIEKLLADVPKGSDGKLSFQDVIDYRDEQKEALKTEVLADLKELGVDTDTDIQLSYDESSGTVKVTNNHPDSKLIERYFKANPDMVEKYANLQSISNLASNAESNLTPQQIMAQYKAESLQNWFTDNSDDDLFSTSLYMSISNTTAAALRSGLNITV